MASDPAKQLERNARLMQLLARTAMKDQQAFAELYRIASPHLFAVALRILREAAAAEEVLQESFVNVWHHAASYVAARSQPLTWLTSIVRNRCLDQLRRREVETVTMDDEEEGVTIAAQGPTPLEMLLAGADALAVRGCFDALEPETPDAAEPVTVKPLLAAGELTGGELTTLDGTEAGEGVTLGPFGIKIFIVAGRPGP